ncbi:hypothetical protein ON010_g4316 [Phytophthora cinnamomi]|nr:hypothetical protein ON010_g4316 [Phytophthora cinnamomi]
MKNPVDEGSPASIELRIQEAEGESRVIADEVKSAMAATETVAPPKTLPSKVLFLDGVRGLAAILVVTQHSHEYLQSLNLGAVAVDAFFVLSSFLLTWLFLKKSIKLMEQGASVRTWGIRAGRLLLEAILPCLSPFCSDSDDSIALALPRPAPLFSRA